VTAQQDEADRLKQGKLDSDPKKNVKPLGLPVPRIYTVSEMLNGAARRLSQPERRALRCTTGSYKLDRITGGIFAGHTWLFGADTSWGKSAWLLSVADENIALGKRVLIVSAEDTEDIYGDRLLVRRADLDATNFRDGRLELDDHRKITEVCARAPAVPVYCDARRYPVEELAGHLRMLIREHKIDLVAFDYVQEFVSRRRYQDDRVKYKEIASTLRHVTKDEKIAGILFSQLTIDEKTKIPTRRNIRECRDMANAAEAILIGFTPSEDITAKRPGDGEVIVADAGTKCIFVDKVKNGPRNRVVPLPWNERSAAFQAEDQYGPRPLGVYPEEAA
jgi:replicative DNA helicase